MKRFLKKKWHHLPLGIVTVILLACLVTGSTFAAYPFLSFTTAVTVDEPMEVEMRWWNYNENVWTDWWPVDGTGEELTLDISPAETQTFGLRINNRSYGSLTVNTGFSGNNVGYFTFNGFPDGSIPASDNNDSNPEWTGEATITANGDTPPGIYNVTFTFTRS